MFGTPVVATDELAIFHLVWTYIIKELGGTKRHVVYAMAPHDQDRYEYLITPMGIASTKQALTCSMQSQQTRTCHLWGRRIQCFCRSTTTEARFLHLPRQSFQRLVGPSQKEPTNCKATQNHLASGKSTSPKSSAV